MKTINVKPWSEDQGAFVVINEADFDPKVHKLYDPEGDAAREREAEAQRQAEIAKAAEEAERLKKLEAQRAADLAAQQAAEAAEAQRLRKEAEAKVTAGQGGTPDVASMTNDQLRAELDARGIKYPAAANKAELQALLVGDAK